MPAYNADIIVNTRVQNQKSLSLAVSSVQKLTRDAAAIKPINLFAPGAGAKASAIGKELEKVKKVARAINRGETGPGKLSSTFAGASDQARILSDVLANVNLNAKNASASVDIFAEAFARAELKAENLRQTFEETLNTARQAEASRTGNFSVALNPAVQAALSPSKVPEQLKRENDQINAVLDARAELFETNKREVRQITEDFFSLSSIEDKVRDENRQINRALDERAELFEKNRKEVQKIEADYFSLQSQERRAETAFAGPFGISSADVNKQLDDRAKLINDTIDEAAEAEIASRKKVAQLEKNLQKELTNLGIKSIEDETLTKIRLQDEAARKDLQAREDVNDKALRDFDAKLNKRVTARKRRERFGEDLLLGAGFPLLFGGGVGAVGGGLLGSVIGGGKGGFGAQIFFSAIGTQFDSLARKGLELADALNKPVQSIDTLLDALPRLDTETKGFINELRAAGLEASASAVVVEEFNKRLKEIGITDVEKFKNDTKEFKDALKELEVAAAALAASKFISIINLLKDGFVILSQLEPQGPLQRAAQAAQVQTELTEAKGQTKTTTTGAEPSQTQIDIQKQFNQLELDSVQIQRDREALIQNSVNLNADQLAIRQAELNVADAVNKTERRILEAKNAQNKEAANRAVEEAQTAERVARIERDRLKILGEIADIQAGRNIRKLEIAENRRLDKAKIQEIQIRQGRLASFALERQLIKQSVKERVELINIERDQFLLANKGRGLDERINAIFDQRVTIARGLVAITDQEIRKKENLLQLEREIDSIRVKTAQRVQLGESADSLQRAQLQLANPFGGDDYERELQRLDQTKELRNIRLQQDAQLLDLQNKLATADDEDVARIANQIVNQLQVNEIIRDEALARQEVERQILNQQQALEKLQPVVDGLTAGFTELFTSTINGSKSAQEVVADTFRQIGEAYINMAAKIIAEQIAMIINEKVLAAFRGTTGTGGGGLGSIFGSLFGGQYADGGRPPVGRASLVGERGPELFVPNRSGTIIPNDQLGGSSNTVTVNVDAKGTEVSGNSDQSRQLGTAISRAVQAELVKQQRPGGVLHSSR